MAALRYPIGFDSDPCNPDMGVIVVDRDAEAFVVKHKCCGTRKQINRHQLLRHIGHQYPGQCKKCRTPNKRRADVFKDLTNRIITKGLLVEDNQCQLILE